MNLLLPLFPGMVAHRTHDEIDAFVRIIANAGYDPVAVAAIVERESAKTWNPKVQGAKVFSMAPGYAVGLIQFSPDTAKKLGTSTKELAAMSFLEQAAYIPKYYSQFFGGPQRFTKPADYYAAGWGSGVGAADTYILAEKGTKAYDANANLDVNGSGTITIGDLSAALTAVVSQGSKNGYWEFDLSADTLGSIRARFAASGAVQQAELYAILKWSKL
jgi:hypothetical protein